MMNTLTKTMMVKGIYASIAALIFLVGFWSLVGNVNFWGTGTNWYNLLIPVLISGSACLLLGWFNSKSFIRALIGAVGALVIGIPVS